MRNCLALLGALLFQPVLHLICFGKLALWYDQMRGEFCVSLPCKQSFRVSPLQSFQLWALQDLQSFLKPSLLSCWVLLVWQEILDGDDLRKVLESMAAEIAERG